MIETVSHLACSKQIAAAMMALDMKEKEPHVASVIDREIYQAPACLYNTGKRSINRRHVYTEPHVASVIDILSAAVGAKETRLPAIKVCIAAFKMMMFA